MPSLRLEGEIQIFQVHPRLPGFEDPASPADDPTNQVVCLGIPVNPKPPKALTDWLGGEVRGNPLPAYIEGQGAVTTGLEFRHGTAGNQSPGREKPEFVTDFLRVSQLVSAQKGCDLFLDGEPADEIIDVAGRLRIEAGGGFVEEQ